MSVRFLIIEGNIRDVRESYRAGTGVSPAEGYGNVLLGIAGGGSYDILNATDADASLPKGKMFKDYDAVVITGSALNLWKQEPESMRQVEVARAVYRANVPFFGSCWGLQVAAVAAGGDVQPNPRGREMGFARRITPLAAGLKHPLLAGRPVSFDAPCSHLDEVSTLPPDATLLASNAVSQVQAAEFRFEGGTFWGVQYHPEYSFAELAFLIDRRMGALMNEGFFANEAEKNSYVADLMAVGANPSLNHIAWRYALGPDLLDADQRVTELRNFIEIRVKPHAFSRAA
ncbi:MAG: GMP synthase [Beijerinckiaceae bacterium]|nr:MAG: GMP synthase [Beijerinckiaceae bacterium]